MIHQAIDIERLIRDAGKGYGVPAGMPIAPGINGYAPDLDQRLPYDPEKARALLAEAGYTDGFSVPLDQYARWTGESEAIAAMLGEVGIKVDVVDKSDGELNQKIASHKTDFYTRSTGYGMLELAPGIQASLPQRRSQQCERCLL